MLVLVGLNLFSIYQVRDLQKKQISISNQLSTEQSALALLAYPSTETLAVNPDVQELVGSLLVDRDKKNPLSCSYGIYPNWTTGRLIRFG